MNVRKIMGVILVAGICGAVVTDANAQGRTRAEARQELIDAENHGLNLVTDTSYPDVSPIYQQRPAQMNAMQDSGTGAGSSGTNESGTKETPPKPSSSDSCVGPVSFCNIYFGS
ncbi:DUF4148 domain-containing protein [Paraburkholderia sp. CNPSo 3274]|uniref:DUF4148 domain-containing protein n=1 Tax=Paraburkholderia sp. CNPSo 3274 TaxID=2940932 RepID=UPI0020B8F2D3|nr:DUF4148 domain-containing protein [Paraburkholderia sp. CNPSo 3274]MCP3709809.1 DUF4148 domain-containing protein [Paraburkholderia sp. CNPSo 3274]